MSTILSALAPIVSPSESRNVALDSKSAGKTEKESQIPASSQVVLPEGVSEIKLPKLSSPKSPSSSAIYKLSALLSNTSLAEEPTAKREGKQKGITLSIAREEPENEMLKQSSTPHKPFACDIEVENGYRLMKLYGYEVGHTVYSSDEDLDKEKAKRSENYWKEECFAKDDYNQLRHTSWESNIIWEEETDEHDHTKDDNQTIHVGSKIGKSEKIQIERKHSVIGDDDEIDDEEIDWEKDDADSVDGMKTKLQSGIAKDGLGIDLKSIEKVVENSQKVSWGEESKQTREGLDRNHIESRVSPALLKPGILTSPLPAILNKALTNNDWLRIVVWDDFYPPKLDPSAEALIVDDNDTSIVERKINQEEDNRVRIAGPLSKYASKLMQNDDDDEYVESEEQKSRRGRKKTREEKMKGRDARLARLRAMGLLFDENEQKEDEDGSKLPLDFSTAWKSSLPRLPDAVRLQSSKAEMKPSEARNFHRPRVKYSRGDIVKIFTSDPGGGVKKTTTFAGQKQVWKKKDLTAREGNIILMEYCEEHPPLLGNAGMTSAICNFYKVSRTTDKDFTPPNLNRGITVVLGPHDKSPFLATLQIERLYPALYTPLFMAPVCEHKLRENEFLLVRPKRSAAQAAAAKASGFSKEKRETVNAKAYLRDIKTVYVVGQTEPQVEVFHPNLSSRSSELRSFLQTFVSYHILRKFNKNPGASLPFQAIRNMFPSLNESTINKALHDVADKAETGANFIVREDAPEESDFRKQLPPHLVCRYESTQAGLQRLFDKHIYFSSKNDVLRTMQSLQLFEKFHIYGSKVMRRFEEATGLKRLTDAEAAKLSDRSLQEISAARFLVEELQLSPWFLSSSYVNMHLRKGQPNNRFSAYSMRLEGVGDPSGRGEAISFLPEADDSFLRKRGRRRRKNALADGEEDDEDDDTRQQKKNGQSGYGGTDFDLRKLSLGESARLLRAHGIPQSQIELLDRWDRITVVESIASSKSGAKLHEKFSKFARHNPKAAQETEAEKEQFQNKINQIFERELNSLSDSSHSRKLNQGVEIASQTAHEEDKIQKVQEDSDSDLDLVGDLEESLAKVKEKTDVNLRKKDDEEKELQKLTQLINNSDEAEESLQEEEIPVRIIPKSAMRPNKQILKRTVIETLANGELRIRVYFIKTKREIEKFKAKQRKRAKETREDLEKIHHRLSEFSKEMKSRDQKRLEYRERKARREGEENFRWYKENLKRFGKDWPLTVKGVGPRCSVCRLKGHASTSPSCPLYFTTFGKNKAVKLKDDSGLKLSFSKKALLDSSPKRGKGKKRSREADTSANYNKKSRKSNESGDIYGRRRNFRAIRKKDRSVRKGAKFDLNTKLKDVWTACARDRNARWFQTRVDKKLVPNYYSIIKKPMDLSKMLKKLEIFQYSSTAEFLNDLQQMLDNSVTFNGATSEISQCAEALLGKANSLISAEKSMFDHLDEEVSRSGASHRKSAKTSTKKEASKETAPELKYMPSFSNPFIDDFVAESTATEDKSAQEGHASAAIENSATSSMQSSQAVQSPGNEYPQMSPSIYESDRSQPISSPSPSVESSTKRSESADVENLANIDLEELEGEVVLEEEEEEEVEELVI